MTDNKISIIVPVFNLENYIKKTVESILMQDYRNIELILVDDGSTDKSGEIIDSLAELDSRILIIHKENGGVTSARLNGIKASSGEWIGFVDGDDIIDSDMFEHLLTNAIKYQVAISHCGYQMVFEDGRIRYFYNTGRVVQQDNLTGLKDLLSGSFVEPGLCNKLFHKDLFYNLLHENIMDISIKNNEDLLMNFVLFLNAKKSVYEDFCPYHYIIRQSSASRQTLNKNKIYDPIKVKKCIIDLAPDSLKSEAEAAYFSTCLDVYSSLVSCCDKKFKLDKKEVRRLIFRKRKSIKLLDKRRRVLANLVLYIPHLYPMLYRAYSKLFQEKKYD